MEIEYIEKLAATTIPVLPKEHREFQTMNLDGAYENGWYDALECVAKIPPADVRPVVRGEWLKSPECPEEYDICSVCGLNDKHRIRGNAEHPALESIPPFCKWCGADMRPITDLPKEGENECAD